MKAFFYQNLNLPTTISDAKLAKAEMGKILGKIVGTALLVEFLGIRFGKRYLGGDKNG